MAWYDQYFDEVDPTKLYDRELINITTAAPPKPALPEADKTTEAEGTGLLSKLLRGVGMVGEGIYSWLPPETRKMHGMIKGIPPERIEEYATPLEPHGALEHALKLGGELVPVGLSYKAVGYPLRYVLPKALSPLAKIGVEAARGTAAGALYEGARAATEGRPAKDVAIAAPLWGLGDVAITGAMRHPLTALLAAGVGGGYGAWRAHTEDKPVAPYALGGALAAGTGAALLKRLAGAARADKVSGKKVPSKVEEILAGTKRGEPAAKVPEAAPSTEPITTTTPDLIDVEQLTDRSYIIVRDLVENGVAKDAEHARKIVAGELHGTGIPFEEANDIAGMAMNRYNLIQRSLTEPEIKATAMDLAKIYKSHGELHKARENIIKGLRQEYGKSNEEAAAIADDVLAQLKREAPPAPKPSEIVLHPTARNDLATMADTLHEYFASQVGKVDGSEKVAHEMQQLASKIRGTGKISEKDRTTLIDGWDKTIETDAFKTWEQARSAPAKTTVPPEETVDPIHALIERISPDDADTLEHLLAARNFWNTRVYQYTPRGVTKETGAFSSYTDINARDAAKKASDLNKIITEAAQSGKFTDKHKEDIKEFYRKLTNTAKSKDKRRIASAKDAKEALASAKKLVDTRVRQREVTPPPPMKGTPITENVLNDLDTALTNVSAQLDELLTIKRSGGSTKESTKELSKRFNSLCRILKATKDPEAIELIKQFDMLKEYTPKSIQKFVDDASELAIKYRMPATGLPEVKAGDTVYFAGDPYLVLDASDPTYLHAIREGGSLSSRLERALVEYGSSEKPLPTGKTITDVLDDIENPLDSVKEKWEAVVDWRKQRDEASGLEKESAADEVNNAVEELREHLTELRSVLEAVDDPEAKNLLKLFEGKKFTNPQEKTITKIINDVETFVTKHTPTTVDETVGIIVLDDLGATTGAEIKFSDILKHNLVGGDLNVAKQIMNMARKRDVIVKPDETMLYSGIDPTIIKKQFEAWKARKYSSIFTPIGGVSKAHGSLPRKQLELLPQELRQNILAVDQKIIALNNKIKNFQQKHGTKNIDELIPEDRDKLDELIATRQELSTARNKFLPDVTAILRKGEDTTKLSERLQSALQTGSIHGGVPIYDKEGTLMGHMFKGLDPKDALKETYIPMEYAPTKWEDVMLRTRPGLYAQHMGLARDLFGESLVRPYRNAKKLFQLFTHKYEQKLENILKPVLFDVKARERVYGVLEGKPLKGTTEQEIKMGKQIREQILDPLFTDFNIPVEKYIVNYAPRIREAGSIAEAYPQGVPRELTFFAELERKGVEFPHETDALTTLLKYIRQGARKKFFDPVLQKTLPYIARKEVNPLRRDLYLKFVADTIGRPLEEEIIMNDTLAALKKSLLEAFSGGLSKAVPEVERRRTATEAASLITRLTYAATLWFNPKSWLNQTTQQILAIAALDPNPLVGLRYWNKAQKLLSTKEGQELLNYNWVAQNRDYIEAFERIHGRPEDLTGSMYDKLKVALGKTTSRIEKSPLGMGVFEAGDRWNVNTSYLMKVLKEIDNGKTHAEASALANKFAADTQFLYGIDSPLLTRTPWGKVLGVLTSYPTNYARLLYEYGRRKGDIKSQLTAISIFSTMTASMYALSESGLDFSREAPMSTLGGMLPVKLATQGIEAAPAVEALIGTAEVTRSFAKRALDDTSVLVDPIEREKAFEQYKRTLRVLIPWSTQRGRIEKFIEAAKNDWNVLDEESKRTYRMGEIAGEPAEVGLLSKLGITPPGGMMYHATEGELPGEAIRTLIGQTTEQRARYEGHKKIGAEQEAYRDLRSRALNNYLRYLKTKDTKYYDAFRRAQQRLVDVGGNPITLSDVKRQLGIVEETALERQRRRLPKTYMLEGEE